jgi:hypothetical protein
MSPDFDLLYSFDELESSLIAELDWARRMRFWGSDLLNYLYMTYMYLTSTSRQLLSGSDAMDLTHSTIPWYATIIH